MSSEETLKQKPKENYRRCRSCNGSGIDKNLHKRWTSGGHDDRSCRNCNGEGILKIES